MVVCVLTLKLHELLSDLRKCSGRARVPHCLLCLFVHIFSRCESSSGGGVPSLRRMTFLLLLTIRGSFPPSWNDTWDVLDPKANPELVWNHNGPGSVGTWAYVWREGLSFPPKDSPIHGSFGGLVPWFCFPWKNTYFFWTVHVTFHAAWKSLN